MTDTQAPQARAVAYLRVSTQRQGRSGLGLEAQRETIARHCQAHRIELAGEYIEVETGKGADALDRRPQLKAALTAAKRIKAPIIVAKLDRLSRDAHFLLGLEKAGVEFVAADMPNANRLTVRLMAVIALAVAIAFPLGGVAILVLAIIDFLLPARLKEAGVSGN